MAEERKLPTAENFFMNHPLYEEISYTQDDADELSEMLFTDRLNDVHCPDCKSSSLFSLNRQSSSGFYAHWREDNNKYYKRVFTCLRNGEHTLTFFFRIDNFKVQKVGQYPSMADLNTYDVKKYSTVLGGQQYSDLRKAIGLVSHGIGIGSFVYIRRIFEDLVDGAKKQAVAEGALDIDAYSSCRMAEKIKMLEKFLPPFLVEHRALYGILSKGVHELTEDECLRSFDIVKVGIEIILDEHLEQKARQKKIDTASKAIKKLQY
ncbi:MULTISPECIES: short-chain dehydrogenase [Serratia]|uniref:short-chain dehydrogenase n=1 Tax=Serratia TaxID=613 RepID=UPI001151147E|nr:MULTISPECIES: short-chain dehydrogenase [Serratia]MBH3140945.1 hypothetical protein [Serratia ureilytica]MBN5263868.1 hypothetical protein [Serratia marcescens]QDI38307.1 short-chain dehydrogenase [Serratia marcescens]BEL85355.1 hypothetical protein SM12VA4_20160 [Serratia marcescens]